MDLALAFFDVAPSAGVIGGMAAIALFLVLAGLGLIVFFALRRTVKMAFRLAIVAIMLFIGVAGSVSLWYFASDGRKGPPRRPAPPANGRR
ncbi:MAG: hypothetical protein IT173_18565 [Acidobacteria bacterium]|nr:hypothetical protein [Acidobacteriota bacterium]